jgi:hypothetical protein
MGGKSSVMAFEAQIAKTVLSGITGAPYLATRPRPDDLSKKPKWYVSCLDAAYYNETAHADTVWSDERGTIWVESTRLGSTTDWVERAYGEVGAAKASVIDYRNLSTEEIQAKLQTFPKVSEFIESCKKVLVEVSSESGIELEMVSDGKEGIAWFLFRAKVGPYEKRSLGQRLREIVAALKEAYDRAASEKQVIEKLSGYS